MMAISIAAVCLLVLMSFSERHSVLNNKVFSSVLLCVITLIISVTVVSRQQQGDTLVYIRTFESTMYATPGELFASATFDKVFTFLQWTVSRVTESPYVFLACVWAIFLAGLFRFLNKLFNKWQVLFVFFTYTTYAIFYSYATIALRQGLAISMLLFALSYSVPEGKPSIKMLPWLVLSALLHWSSIPFALIAFVLPRYSIKLRYILGVWGLLAAGYVLNLQRYVLSPFVSYLPKVELYTSDSILAAYAGVNRIDFLLFSLLWILLSVLAYRFYFQDETYKTLIKYYVAYNSVFLVMGFVAFSDRIAGYSWFLVPLLIWFPILKRDRYVWALSTITLLLFMVFSFYTGTIKYYDLFAN